jgi:uncharacterized protein YxeA
MLIFLVILIFIILVILAIIGYYSYNKSEFNEVIEADCKYKRWGCCNDKLTTRLDQDGTNCRGF